MMNAGRFVRVAGVLGLALAMARPALAGPPLICDPFDAGSAQLLPWAKGTGWKQPDPNYDIQRLTVDLTRLLTPSAPVLARMENMRRATIYAGQDRRVAAELLATVLGRALSSAAQGSRDPLAWFDAGYLIESYRQAGYVYAWDMLPRPDRAAWAFKTEPTLDGYALVRKAMDLGGSPPEMEFAASLMKEGPVSAEHRRKALAGASAGSLLAKNLSSEK